MAHQEQYEKLADTSTTTLYVDISNDSDDDLVKILEEEDYRMDKVLEDLLNIYKDEDNESKASSSLKGFYMDVSFEYFNVDSISKEDSILS